MLVDLERRQVIDVLPDHTAQDTARWLRGHPEVKVISRDRCRLYAQGALRGAPQAWQVADRFHLLQNLRACIESQMSRVGRHHGRSLVGAPHGVTNACETARQAQRDARRAMFERVQQLHAGGKTMRVIAAQTGVGWRTVTKWIRSGCLRDRHRPAPGPRSPWRFQDYLRQRCAEGCTHVSQTHRIVSASVSRFRPMSARPTADECEPLHLLTPFQTRKLEALKQASPSFAAMRRLAMRFRGLLRGGDAAKLDAWLRDARASGIGAMQRFARRLGLDLDAVGSAVTETWSNGQTEGQINKLKTLKRAMYGRAGAELLPSAPAAARDHRVSTESESDLLILAAICSDSNVSRFGSGLNGWICLHEGGG